MLSRLTPNSDTEPELFVELFAEDNSFVMAVLTESTREFVPCSELKRESLSHATLQQVCHFLQTEWPKQHPEELKPFYRLRDELSVWNDCCLAGGDTAVHPDSLQQRVLTLAHDGQPGIVRMKQRCRDAVWWPGIDTHIEHFVANCEACHLS